MANLNLFEISGSGLEEKYGFCVSLVLCHARIPRKRSSKYQQQHQTNLKTFTLFEDEPQGRPQKA